MRTSGFASETRLTVAVFLIAFGIVVLLAGGPEELMLTIQQGLQACLTAVVQLYHGPHA